MATDQAASLREAFQAAMIALTGTTLLGDGTLWWVAVYVLIFGAVGSRLLLDMRPSRLSMAALLAAAVAQALVMASRLGWVAAGSGVDDVHVPLGSEMAGNLMLLSAMALHARYVLLDAEGLLPRRQPAADDAASEEDDAEAAYAPGRRAPGDDRPAARHVAADISAASSESHRVTRIFCAPRFYPHLPPRQSQAD